MNIVFKTLLFTLLLPGSVTVVVPYLIISSGLGLTGEIGNWRLTGIIPIVLGVAVYIATVCDFIVSGKGKPAPIGPPKRLVSRRLYSIVRNPMYIGVLMVLAGEAIFLTSITLLFYIILVWFIFHLFVVCYEEPTLKKKYGEAYHRYFRTTPRWIPKLKLMKD
ncbi:methyltransferase family protein [Chloroflexota bacterium]